MLIKNHRNCKTGPEATSLTVATEGARRGDPGGGLQRRQLHALRTGPRCQRSQAQHSLPVPAPGAAKLTSLQLGQTCSSEPDTPGRLPASGQHPAKDRPTAKTPACSRPALPGVGVLLGVRSRLQRVSQSPAQRTARSYARAVCCWAFSFESHNL